jgi:hypothetical protein
MSIDEYFKFVDSYRAVEVDPVSLEVYGEKEEEIKNISTISPTSIKNLPLDWIIYRVNNNKFLFFQLETATKLFLNNSPHKIPWIPEIPPKLFLDRIKLYNEFINFYKEKKINIDYDEIKLSFVNFIKTSNISYHDLLLAKRFIKLDDIDEIFSKLSNIKNYREITNSVLNKASELTWIIRPSSIKDTNTKFARVISYTAKENKIYHTLFLFIIGYGYIIMKTQVYSRENIDNIDFTNPVNIFFTNIIDLLLYLQDIKCIQLDKYLKI